MKSYTFISILAVALFINACTGSKAVEVVEILAETGGQFEVEPNTVYKRYPDGTLFLEQKSIYDNGRISEQYFFVSRKNSKPDPPYLHDQLKRITYQYQQDRLVEKVLYSHDSVSVKAKDTYVYKGDSVVHYYQTWHNKTGEPMRKELIDIHTYENDQLVKLKTIIGYREDYILEKWTYEGDELREYMIDNYCHLNTKRFGENVFRYDQKTVFFKEGKPAKDIVYDYQGEERDTLAWTTHYYDSYGTVNREETIWSDYKNGKIVKDFDSKTSMTIQSNRWRNKAVDPNVNIAVVNKNNKTKEYNYRLGRQNVRVTHYTYNNGFLSTRVDSFEMMECTGCLNFQNTIYSYDDQNRVVHKKEERDMVIIGRKDKEARYSYYEDGSLKSETYTELFDSRQKVVVEFSRDGSLIKVSQSRILNDGIRDSLVEQYDSIRGQAIAKVSFRDGEAYTGFYKEYDENGNLLRDFDEVETNSDVQYFYNENGNLKRSSHFRVNWLPLVPFKSELKFELLYGNTLNLSN